MSGAIRLLPLYDFMAWTGTTFPLPFASRNVKLTYLRNTQVLYKLALAQ